MKAVKSETRAPCCMLWVTITRVYSDFSSSISSSILAVEIGSSAEHGSSNRMTFGRTATVRAMHSRCCWAPGRLKPLAARFSFEPPPKRRPRQRPLHPFVQLGSRQPLIEPDAEGDVLVDRHRERRRLLEHHADPCAQQVEVLLG